MIRLYNWPCLPAAFKLSLNSVSWFPGPSLATTSFSSFSLFPWSQACIKFFLIYLSLLHKPNILSPVGETCYSLLEKFISFFFIYLIDIHSQCVCVFVHTCLCSVMSNCLLPHGTVAHQAQSMEFSRQKCWSGLPFLLQGIFSTQGLNLHLLHLLHW